MFRLIIFIVFILLTGCTESRAIRSDNKNNDNNMEFKQDQDEMYNKIPDEKSLTKNPGLLREPND